MNEGPVHFTGTLDMSSYGTWNSYQIHLDTAYSENGILTNYSVDLIKDIVYDSIRKFDDVVYGGFRIGMWDVGFLEF